MRRRERRSEKNRLPAPSFVTTVPTTRGDEKVGVYLLFKPPVTSKGNTPFSVQAFEGEEGYNFRPVDLNSPSLQRLVPASPAEVAYLTATAETIPLYALMAPASIIIPTPNGKIALGRNATTGNILRALERRKSLEQLAAETTEERLREEKKRILKEHQNAYGVGEREELEERLRATTDAYNARKEEMSELFNQMKALEGEEPRFPEKIREAIEQRLSMRGSSLEDHTQREGRGTSEVGAYKSPSDKGVMKLDRQSDPNRKRIRVYLSQPFGEALDPEGVATAPLAWRPPSSLSPWKPSFAGAVTGMAVYSLSTFAGYIAGGYLMDFDGGIFGHPHFTAASLVEKMLPNMNFNDGLFLGVPLVLGISAAAMLGTTYLAMAAMVEAWDLYHTTIEPLLHGQYGSVRRARRELGTNMVRWTDHLRAHKQNVRRMEEELGVPLIRSYYQG